MLFSCLVLLSQYATQQFHNRLHMMSKVYGSAVPMTLMLESKILSQFQRGGGLVSSHIGLENLLGMEDEIDFNDWLNRPEAKEKPVQPFEEMERRLGDKPLGKFL